MISLNDFFCGAGGMGLGFKQAGFDIKGAWDFDKYAVQTYAANVGDHVNHGQRTLVKESFRVRKLTPREYARLQGFPDSFKQVVSNSQFYKQMGNAVTVNVSNAIAQAIREFLD